MNEFEILIEKLKEKYCDHCYRSLEEGECRFLKTLIENEYCDVMDKIDNL